MAHDASLLTEDDFAQIRIRLNTPNPESTIGCWDRPLPSRGAPRIVYRGQIWRAHRLSWLAFHGPVPFDHEIRKKCNNPGCHNPDHLAAVRPGDPTPPLFEN